jgi:hypothetical protein
MPRIDSITQASFDGVPVALVLSARVGRSAAPKPLASDYARFATSVQIGTPVLTAELRTRDVATAESLALGRAGRLEFTTAATAAEQPARRVTLDGAVLYAAELVYEQASAAVAVLRFMLESGDALTDPFAAQEVAP